MRKVKPSWKSGVVLVCTNERPATAEKPSCGLARGTELRNWLKDKIKSEGLKGEILSCKTSCLGICSALGVTVDIVPLRGGEHRTLVVDPERDRDALWEQVKAVIMGESAPSVEEL